ncbi:MAG TPA: HD domain-containing protein [Terriglobales bacterium]|nr:HD domain-containing protein [Terriglobales bacterium]
MNRRTWMQGLGTLAFGCRCWGGSCPPSAHFVSRGAASSTTEPAKAAPAALPAAVAGIRLVDSKVARMATELSRDVSPAYLFNHAVRTFLLGALVGRAAGQSFDEELLYLACILHDLGLTERFGGDRAFETEGAEAAKHFLQRQSYEKDRIEVVWDGIAMHASAIGEFKRPEIALVGEGAGADVLGPDFSLVKKSDVAAVLAAFPRLQFKSAFVKTCADVVSKHPRGAGRSFMRDVGERHVPDFRPTNFCDLIAQAPFEE